MSPIGNCASTFWDTGSCDGWSPDFGQDGLGADGPIYALIEWRGRTIAAGQFSEIGGVQTNSIAEFDGERWRGMAGGIQELYDRSVQRVAYQYL